MGDSDQAWLGKNPGGADTAGQVGNVLAWLKTRQTRAAPGLFWKAWALVGSWNPSFPCSLVGWETTLCLQWLVRGRAICYAEGALPPMGGVGCWIHCYIVSSEVSEQGGAAWPGLGPDHPSCTGRGFLLVEEGALAADVTPPYW